MKPSILITGISGFVGTKLVTRLDMSLFSSVYLLIPESVIPGIFHTLPDNVHIIRGELEDLSFFENISGRIDILLHMAAVTGKAGKPVYDRINFRAFAELIPALKKKGLRNVLFLSTIAVGFSRKSRYFYAFSKEKSEDFLKESGTDFTILRPTMILGAGSPVFKGFSLFAGLPLIPLFGGGRTLIQPVHIDDICSTIGFVLENSVFNNEIIEIGCPETISIRDFLQKISLSTGKRPRFLPVPMWVPVLILSVLDRIAYPLLPLTLGQLATFRNDSTASDNSVLKQLSGGFSGIDRMISDSLTGEIEEKKVLAALKECRTLTRYLIGCEPTEYVKKKYLDFLQKVETNHSNGFDRILSRISSGSVFFTKIADAYSRFFFPRSVLRKKLGYLFAILETSPGTYRVIDDIGIKKSVFILLSLAFRGGWFAFHLSVSAVILLPLQIIFGRGGNIPAEGDKIG